jgi:hypothetical protein
MSNHDSWASTLDRYSSRSSEPFTWSVLCQTPMFEPANSEVFSSAPGTIVTPHLPSSSGAASAIDRARYGPLTSIGATPEMNPCVWSKSELVGTLPSA